MDLTPGKRSKANAGRVKTGKSQEAEPNVVSLLQQIIMWGDFYSGVETGGHSVENESNCNAH